jgi:hypothetical protein
MLSDHPVTHYSAEELFFVLTLLSSVTKRFILSNFCCWWVTKDVKMNGRCLVWDAIIMSASGNWGKQQNQPRFRIYNETCGKFTGIRNSCGFLVHLVFELTEENQTSCQIFRVFMGNMASERRLRNFIGCVGKLHRNHTPTNEFRDTHGGNDDDYCSWI